MKRLFREMSVGTMSDGVRGPGSRDWPPRYSNNHERSKTILRGRRKVFSGRVGRTRNGLAWEV